jgi:hypothetical protein
LMGGDVVGECACLDWVGYSIGFAFLWCSSHFSSPKLRPCCGNQCAIDFGIQSYGRCCSICRAYCYHFFGWIIGELKPISRCLEVTDETCLVLGDLELGYHCLWGWYYII